jgi:hypothetical protein
MINLFTIHGNLWKNDFSQCLNSLTNSTLKNCQISKWLNMSRGSTIKFRGWLLATTHIGNDGALLLDKILSYPPSDKGGSSVFTF